MNSGLLRILAALVAVIAIVGAIFLRRGDGGNDTPATSTGTEITIPTVPGSGAAPEGAVAIQIAFSPEKEALLADAIEKFNAKQQQVGGKPIFVEAIKKSSGAALTAIADGTLQPTIWTPSSSLWGRLLNKQKDVSWVPDENASFVRTPLVVAMWEDQAKALGWPGKQLGWADVLREAQNPQGWAAYGHPEWGPFRLGHTNPDFSTSGLSAVAAEYYAATGKSEGLRLTDVEDPAVRQKVQAIQSSIVHYGDTTLFFADELVARGPAFASAVAMEETTILDANKKLREAGQNRKLVAIYPREGTFFSDNPLIVMDAPWVSDEQKEAAKAFSDFLLTADVQANVGDFGFRPSDPNAPVAAALGADNGVDPAQPTRLLSLPDPTVLSRIKDLWREDRKPADVVLVVDTSGSMYDEDRLVQAQRGLTRFLEQISPRDRVALVSFNTTATQVTPLVAMDAPARQALIQAVNGLFADGDTAVYDATLQGLEILKKSGDPKHIQAVVVLTDGEDNSSSAPVEDVVRQLQKQTEGGGARVFTIAYNISGSPEILDALTAIAKAAGGKAYKSDTDNIDAVYTSISSFF